LSKSGKVNPRTKLNIHVDCCGGAHTAYNWQMRGDEGEEKEEKEEKEERRERRERR
jgi:hypothetical protein